MSQPLADWRPQVVLADLLTAPDPRLLDALLGERPRFHSPVADYEDRAEIVRILGTIPTVVEGLRSRRGLEGDHEVMTFIEGRVGDRRIEGVLDEHFDDDGRLTTATLMLRPLSALRVAVKSMGERLAAEAAGEAR